MRAWMVLFIAIALLLGAIQIFRYTKFDTVVSITVVKGPLKGLNFKLVDYKVSYQDLQVKNKFWDSQLGQAIFRQLSTAVQAAVLASKKYVQVQFEVNYFRLWRRHYRLIEKNGQVDLALA